MSIVPAIRLMWQPEYEDGRIIWWGMELEARLDIDEFGPRIVLTAGEADTGEIEFVLNCGEARRLSEALAAFADYLTAQARPVNPVEETTANG